jgi:raffinose/stachyose/melibiose transport system substrate-binding protein
VTLPSNPLASRTSRRNFLTAVGLGAAGLGLAACVGPGTTRGNTPAGAGGSVSMPAPVGAAPVTGAVSFAHWRAEDKATFDTIIGQFQTENPGATVTQDIAPSADYQATALQRIKTGAVGDVFTAFRGSQFEAMVKANLFIPLGTQPFVDNYQAKLIRAGRSGGIEMGLPYQLVYPMPLYNKALFEQVGITEIPKDWDGFLAMCETLKGAGLYPIAWPGADIGNAGQLFNSMVMNNGPTPDMCTGIQDGTFKCTDDWFITTLQQYQQLIPYFQPSPTGTAPAACQQLFSEQKAAMLATGSYDISSVRKLGATFPVDVLSPITVPADKAKYTGTYNATFILGVSSVSAQQEAALKFVEFLSRPEIASEYANGTSQLVTVEGVHYQNADLAAITHWNAEPTLLAPRYQFTNLDVQHAVEGAAIAVVGGTAPEQAAQAAQTIVEQNR